MILLTPFFPKCEPTILRMSPKQSSGRHSIFVSPSAGGSSGFPSRIKDTLREGVKKTDQFICYTSVSLAPLPTFAECGLFVSGPLFADFRELVCLRKKDLLFADVCRQRVFFTPSLRLI